MSENILEVSHLTHYFKLNKKVSIKAVDCRGIRFRQINAGQMSDECL